QLRRPSEKEAKAYFLVEGLSEKELGELSRAHWEREQWTGLFSIRVDNSQKKEQTQLPPVLGSYRVENQSLLFEPRFPLVAGVPYRATFDPARLHSSQPSAKPIVATFLIPKPQSNPTTKVEYVYPSAEVLPENQLKFYIHFSAPMSKGEAYQHVHLMRDEAGEAKDIANCKLQIANLQFAFCNLQFLPHLWPLAPHPSTEVALPFLRLDEELWDQKQTRFTLLFDPGRIKRGLKPREEVGPALEEGKSYTLVIDSDWTDAEGNPLKESFRKSFRAGPPDDNPIDPKSWKIKLPSASSRDPLVVIFPKPLDHAMLERVVGVTDAAGHPLDGTISVTEKETHWSLTPKQPWQAGHYHLTADTTLEDLAGNSIGRPFEVDVFHPIQRQVKSETVKVPFDIAPGK
ncbi:MAG TPA: hypothetical protein VGX70_21625, partial [Gemmataceae bacterium]|nr:hypothetical protein [Gemmataceae bacterium]